MVTKLSPQLRFFPPFAAMIFFPDGGSESGFPDYIRTYDGVLDASTISKRVFRLQEGAIVKVICSLLPKMSMHLVDSKVDMYATLNEVRIGKKDEPWAIDGVELTEFLQNYQSDGNAFTNRYKRRFLVMTYTARMEDNGKELACRVCDEDSTDSFTPLSRSQTVIKLLVLRKYVQFIL